MFCLDQRDTSIVSNIKIEFFQVDSIADLPEDFENQAMIFLDFDLTIKEPVFVASDLNRAPTRKVGVYDLRGGVESYQRIKRYHENALGCFILSAAHPSQSTLDSITIEMQKIVLPISDVPISDLFLPHKIILNGYEKAGGAIEKLKTMPTLSTKIERILFVDDFVTNSYNFACEIVPILKEINHLLADEVIISCVWLNPAEAIQRKPSLQRIIESGAENSNLDDWRHYQALFPKSTPIQLTALELLSINECIANANLALRSNPPKTRDGKIDTEAWSDCLRAALQEYVHSFLTTMKASNA